MSSSTTLYSDVWDENFILPLLWLSMSTAASLLQSCAPDTLTPSAQSAVNSFFSLQSPSRTAVWCVEKLSIKQLLFDLLLITKAALSLIDLLASVMF